MIFFLQPCRWQIEDIYSSSSPTGVPSTGNSKEDGEIVIRRMEWANDKKGEVDRWNEKEMHRVAKESTVALSLATTDNLGEHTIKKNTWVGFFPHCSSSHALGNIDSKSPQASQEGNLLYLWLKQQLFHIPEVSPFLLLRLEKSPSDANPPTPQIWETDLESCYWQRQGGSGHPQMLGDGLLSHSTKSIPTQSIEEGKFPCPTQSAETIQRVKRKWYSVEEKSVMEDAGSCLSSSLW